MHTRTRQLLDEEDVEQSKDVNSKSLKRKDSAPRIDDFICSLNEIKSSGALKTLG
jgi:hypothetical protein